MKQHLTAIAFNEKELEAYIAQLKTQSFETVSDVTKATDGSFYQALAKTIKAPAVPPMTPSAAHQPSTTNQKAV